MSNFFIMGYYVSMKNMNIARLRKVSCNKSTTTQTFLGSYHFYWEGGIYLWGGGPKFFGIKEGELKGASIFPCKQRGQNFFTYAKRWGPEKMATCHHKQTPPLLVKNDNLL